jgi:hypothetical protein
MWPSLVVTRLDGPQLRVRWKNLGRRLREELADDLGTRRLEVRGQRVERRPRRLIKPQHEAPAIAAGLMGAPFCLSLVPASGEVRHTDVLNHVAQPWREVHSRRGRGVLRSRVKLDRNVA